MESKQKENGTPSTVPLSFDGMTLPPFPPLLEDAKGRCETIRDLKTRTDDVILVTFPKSGSHWVWEILNMLLRGAAEYMKTAKASQMLEAMPDLSIVDKLTSHRHFNTHLPYRWLPKQHLQSGGKIVHVLRNPKDVAVSMYHHLKSSGEIGNMEDVTFAQFVTQQFFSPNKAYGGWFEYEKEFEKADENDNTGAIYTLHYESLKKNPIKEITRLAEFLNVTCSEELIKEIAKKCSFQNLKEAQDTIKGHDALNAVMQPSKEGVRSTADYKTLSKKLFRKGQIGDWKNHFTVALNEQFDALFTEEMKMSKLQIEFE